MNKKRSAAKTMARKRKAPAKGVLRGSPGVGKAESLRTLLEVLQDRTKPIKTRLSALQSLGAARFASADFPSIQGDFIAALRAVADDPDFEMRQRVLGILAREKDGFTQRKLLEGLQDPEKALLPPEKALQLLGYDVHADAYAVAREIVRNPPNQTARREALRLLAGDAASAPMFEKILRDKNENLEIREVSAAALHALKPEQLQEQAREMLMDPSEHDAMHQTSLTALTQFGRKELASDQRLMERVDQMSTEAPAQLQDSARLFLGKYGR